MLANSNRSGSIAATPDDSRGAKVPGDRRSGRVPDARSSREERRATVELQQQEIVLIDGELRLVDKQKSKG